jgi:diaminopimelate decarboxylase
VLATLAAEGLGADVVSGGEYRRARAAGIAPDKIVFSGVGKTEAEMALALEGGLFQFNLESVAEAEMLSGVATSMGRTAPVGFRVNPDVAAGSHAKISTGAAAQQVRHRDRRRAPGLCARPRAAGPRRSRASRSISAAS